MPNPPAIDDLHIARITRINQLAKEIANLRIKMKAEVEPLYNQKYSSFEDQEGIRLYINRRIRHYHSIIEPLKQILTQEIANKVENNYIIVEVITHEHKLIAEEKVQNALQKRESSPPCP